MQDVEGKDKRDPLELPNAPGVKLEDLTSIGIRYLKVSCSVLTHRVNSFVIVTKILLRL